MHWKSSGKDKFIRLPGRETYLIRDNDGYFDVSQWSVPDFGWIVLAIGEPSFSAAEQTVLQNYRATEWLMTG